MTRPHIKEELRRRSEIDEEEVEQVFQDAKADLENMMNCGATLEDMQLYVENDLGLKPDFLEDLIM